MNHRTFLYLFLLLPLFTLVACNLVSGDSLAYIAENSGSPVTASAPACPEATPGTHQLLAPAQGICFLYPDVYNAFQGEDNTVTLYVRSLFRGHVPLAFIGYTAAQGQSLEEITNQRVLDYAWTGTKSESITLGGEAAVILDNLPGQDTNRRVVTVHDGRVYDLVIHGIGANYGTAGELAEELYDTVIASLQFIEVEPEAPLRAGPECPFAGANLWYTNEPFGYCLVLPAAYNALPLDSDGAEVAFYIDSIQDKTHARLSIKVTDANGRSLEEVTTAREAEIRKAAPGSEVMWSWGSLLDGEPANQFHQVPGPEPSREVVLLHAGHLYTLTFVPDDPEASETYDEMERLYEMVMDSFSFLWQSEETSGQ